MLLAVEGGGFFSSSASGYSKGLTLLLLGQNHEDRSMRVSSCNHYQLVDQEPEPDPDLQLASVKARLPHRCASFVCFDRASPELDSPSHLKLGSTQQQDVLPDTLVANKGMDHSTDLDEDNFQKLSLKSSLKKPQSSLPVSHEVANPHDALCDKRNDLIGHTARRKVQWTDFCGNELAEIKEFEPSNIGISGTKSLGACGTRTQCFMEAVSMGK
ncbi:hypothetical protein K2173_011185 [Erythroxylum novogranatense]|uniref:Uncharacterized protein n=1 Tax=Erythroxylum novogranatense TaxID=1862640 RepID=A0AAV8TWK0_9ROSI|nr:hypothetical protein K2173_011185 [Erythroxylum novogranatense]